MLGDVAHPGPVAKALDEPAGAMQREAMVTKAGQQVDQRVGELGQRVGGPVLERAEVDQEPNRRFVGPVVWSPKDLDLQDREFSLCWRFIGDRFVFGVLVPLNPHIRHRLLSLEAKGSGRLGHSDARRSS